jgi:WD40 repeat protein
VNFNDKRDNFWEEGQTILELYEVKQVFRTGGMGLVYRVHHKNWNMDLAVKSPRTDYFRTEEQKQNFIKECETWINLGLHPNIVSCYYVRTLGGIPRVFAEYVEGGSLKDWIENKKLYEEGKDKALERILDIAIQFAWGLHYAHEHEEKLVHQDVKPANVMMTEAGEAKVTDFGLAKARAVAGEIINGDLQKSILVSSGGHTPAYCSPEQANKQPLSRKTDIWSWGLSVLEMFAGEVFWLAGEAASEILESFLKTGAEDGSIPGMPNVLAELLKQCFQHNPDDRPKDMQEIIGRLKEIYKENVGREYSRPEPKAAELLADGLNNKAVSMLDLGKKEEAEKLYDEALKVDSHHPEATYNRGLLLWRTGRITDYELVRQLEEVRTTHHNDWKDEYLLGLIHLERGDSELAVKILKEALKQVPDESAIQAKLQTALTSKKKTLDLQGHRGEVKCIAISPDGRFALSGSGDRTLKLWDLATGQCIRTFEGHTDSVKSVTISPDGRLALSGSEDKTIKFWDLATGICIRTFEVYDNYLNAFTFSADGRFALSGNEYGTLKLWELTTGRCVRTFEGHLGVTSVAFSADGRFALSGSGDRTLKLWDLATGICIRAFEGHTEGVESVAISPDGRFALSGSRDNTLKLWELATGRYIRSFEGYTLYVESVAISPDGRFALSGSGDGTLKLWELSTGRCVRAFQGHTAYLASVKSVAISPDGGFALSGSRDNTLKLWDIKSFQAEYMICKVVRSKEALLNQNEAVQLLLKAKEQILTSKIQQAYWSLEKVRSIPGFERHPDVLTEWQRFSTLAICSKLRSSWCVRTFEGHVGYVASVAISPNGKFVLWRGEDKTLKLWDLATGQCIRTFEGHTDSVKSVAISPDGRLALSGSEDKTLKLWDLATGRCIRIFEDYVGSVASVAISPDSRFTLSEKFGQTQLWELATGRCVRTFKCPVGCVAFSPDSRFVFLGYPFDNLKLWELATGRCVRTLKAHNSWVHFVSFSPDGRFVLSESLDYAPELWELTTGRSIRTFEGHTHSVRSGVFSPDGRFALSGSWDKTLKLWELATGRCVRTFEGHTGYVESVAISPDGRFALSGSFDKTIKFWELATGRCVRTFEGHADEVYFVAISPNGRVALSQGNKTTNHLIKLWWLDWDYEFPEQTDWDESAKPYLEIFLALRCPYGPDGISRVGKPVWNDEDFKEFIMDLQYRGYGWLRPEGVRRKLEEMTANWKGPPPLPGQE